MEFSGPDAVREAIKTNPLFCEWAFNVLVTRGVLGYDASGGVRGLEAMKKEKGGKRSGAEWGKSWPNRQSVIEVADSLGQKGGTLMDFRRELGQRGDIESQWAVLHALWFLEKEKLLRRAGRKYILAGIENGVSAETIEAERLVGVMTKFWEALPAEAKQEYFELLMRSPFAYPEPGELEKLKTWDTVWAKVAPSLTKEHHFAVQDVPEVIQMTLEWDKARRAAREAKKAAAAVTSGGDPKPSWKAEGGAS